MDNFREDYHIFCPLIMNNAALFYWALFCTSFIFQENLHLVLLNQFPQVSICALSERLYLQPRSHINYLLSLILFSTIGTN